MRSRLPAHHAAIHLALRHDHYTICRPYLVLHLFPDRLQPPSARPLSAARSVSVPVGFSMGRTLLGLRRCTVGVLLWFREHFSKVSRLSSGCSFALLYRETRIQRSLCPTNRNKRLRSLCPTMAAMGGTNQHTPMSACSIPAPNHPNPLSIAVKSSCAGPI